MVDLLGERSQNNSFVKHVLGLYLYATGAQRQLISVLSSLGICSSYPSIAGSGDITKVTTTRPSRRTASDDEDSNADDHDYVPQSSDEWDESDKDSEDSESEDDEADEEAEGPVASEALRASPGTDLSASERTSTVSRRSPAKRVIAKSFVCSFSRAELRWRLRKSAWR